MDDHPKGTDLGMTVNELLEAELALVKERKRHRVEKWVAFFAGGLVTLTVYISYDAPT